MADKIIDQIRERVVNQKYFVARGIAYLSERTNIQPELIAQVTAVVLLVLLVFSEGAQVIANSLLIAYPLLITFVYTDECPSQDDQIVYWVSYVVLTILDKSLENIPGYYAFKMILLALLFLEPCNLAEPLKKVVQDIKKTLQEKDASRRSQKEKPKDVSSRDEMKTAQEPVQPSQDNLDSLHGVPTVKNGPAPTPPKEESRSEANKKLDELIATTPDATTAVEEKTATASEQTSERKKIGGKSVYVKLPNEVMVGPRKSLVDSARFDRFKGENPMANNPAYEMTLSSSSNGSGIENKDIGPETTLNDLLFYPMTKIIFNAPFDYDNITYHMRLESRTTHRIAYAVKGNAVPRVMAYPPSGIIKPGEKITVAVTVQKFDYNEFDFSRDRICFEYVLLKDSDKDTQFDHAILQRAPIKHRKNIKIEYNP